MRPASARGLGGAGATVAGFLIALGVAAHGPANDRAVQTTPNDSAMAVRFLTGMRGASPLQCEAALHGFRMGFWRSFHVAPDAGPDERALLAWAADRIRDPAAVAPLAAGLADADPCVRRTAARLLGRMALEDAVAALLRALRSQDARARELAAVGLGYAERRSTVEPLVGALHDDAAPVRAAAAWALGEIEDMRAELPLVEALERDRDPAVRRAAAWALGQLH